MAKGSVEEGFNVLLGIIVFVVVVGFIFLFVLSGTNKYEEQTFLDSVTELQYAMEYVCTTGQTQYVDVRFPQQVSNAQSWIGGMGDPKYMVYYERFPVGEEWSWVTLRFTNPTVVTTEALLIGVGTAVLTGGLGNMGGKATTMGKGGYLSRLFSNADEALEQSYRLEASVQKTSALSKAAMIDGGIQTSSVRGTSVLGSIDDPIQSIIKFFSKSGKVSSKSSRSILVKYKIYLDECEQYLGSVQKSISAGSEVSDDVANVLKLSDGAFEDTAKAQRLIEYIDNTPAEKFGDYADDIVAYRKSLSNNRRFMMGELFDGEFDPTIFTNDDLKAFFNAFQSTSNTFKYIQYPRNIILPAVAGKGTWALNTYVFDNMLSPLDRANQKFNTCGAKSLCAKTQNYIAVYPLQKCDASGVEYVQIHIKKNPDIAKLSWADALPTSWTRYITNEDKRFYIASPCGERYKIEKGTCKCHSTLEPVYKMSYSEDMDTGEWGFDFTQPGMMRVCDEGTDASSASTVIAIGDTVEDVPCLIVTPTGESLQGYGIGKDYNNFCNSLPESYYKASDNGLIAASFLVDLGLTSAGYTSVLIPIANNVIVVVGNAEQAKAFLWPSGGLG